MITLKGTPRQIGQAYGKACTVGIRENLSVLIERNCQPSDPLPLDDPHFHKWVDNQEALLSKNWPWLLEEMAGVGQALDVRFKDILLLNLRAWQYSYYGLPGPACSSVALMLADGTVACAGALDDPVKYYCGPVCFQPDDGYALMTFPISGTSWASRAMNEKGLSMGISSQVLPGLKKCDHAINQDLAIRIVMQTCATVDEVRTFCKEHPFTMNLVCVDANGGMFCAHNTTAGLFEVPVQSSAAMTNHIVDDEIRRKLAAMGATEFPETDTTRARRANLTSFAKQYGGKCTAEEVMTLMSTCDETNPGTINRHNHGSAYLTFANPQNDPKRFWVMQPHIETEFRPLKICEQSRTTLTPAKASSLEENRT